MKLPKYIAPPPDVVQNFVTTTMWAVSEEEGARDRFLELINEASNYVADGIHFGDNFFTWCRNNSCLSDEAFRVAWGSNVISDSDVAIVWRRYITATMAFHAAHLEGDFVECGVYMGTGIKTVIDYLGGPDFHKTFWGYDTFDSNPVVGHEFPGQEEGCFERVQARFAGYSKVRLIKGFIPDSFSGNLPEKICYLHVDLNNAQGEIAVLENLFDRIVPGGVIVFDDYEWSNIYRPQKLAEDPWLDARGYRVTPLPTGQGLVIKR